MRKISYLRAKLKGTRVRKLSNIFGISLTYSYLCIVIGMKRVFKWIGIVLLSPILLFIILAALLYLPPVQNWVAQKVASYASEQTGMEITVEHVDIDFPLDLGIDGIRVIKPRSSIEKDTIADIRRAVADVQFWPLLKGMIVLDALELHDAKLNTLDFIDDMRLQGTIGNLSF